MSKSVWIVDDDQSIRWVLEKALTREGLSHRSFGWEYHLYTVYYCFIDFSAYFYTIKLLY